MLRFSPIVLHPSLHLQKSLSLLFNHHAFFRSVCSTNFLIAQQLFVQPVPPDLLALLSTSAKTGLRVNEAKLEVVVDNLATTAGLSEDKRHLFH